MSDTTTHLGLPYLLAAQAQKHVTHNEALRLLDAMVHSEMLPIHPLSGNPFYWGGMEPVSILLVPLAIWLTAQYALVGVQAVRKSRVVARLMQR